jgi:hypothetical protein
MPERHLLDILKHAEHWSRYTRHFGPPSGSDPKLAQAVQRYLFTVFPLRLQSRSRVNRPTCPRDRLA